MKFRFAKGLTICIFLITGCGTGSGEATAPPIAAIPEEAPLVADPQTSSPANPLPSPTPDLTSVPPDDPVLPPISPIVSPLPTPSSSPTPQVQNSPFAPIPSPSSLPGLPPSPQISVSPSPLPLPTLTPNPLATPTDRVILLTPLPSSTFAGDLGVEILVSAFAVASFTIEGLNGTATFAPSPAQQSENTLYIVNSLDSALVNVSGVQQFTVPGINNTCVLVRSLIGEGLPVIAQSSACVE